MILGGNSDSSEHFIPDQTEHIIPEMAEHLKAKHKHYISNSI
jgi:hypothetical protein